MAVIDAQGSTLTIDDGGDPGSAVEIGELISFSGFDGEAPDNDISTLSSTAAEFRQGLQDNGNFSCEVFRDPSDPGQAECLTARAARATREFVLTYEDGSTDTFDGYVKSVSKSGEVGGQLRGTINIKITGDVTETPAP